jgi:hypothetical protein
MAKKGAAIRWSRERERKAAQALTNASLSLAPDASADLDFQSRTLLRVRAQISMVQDQIDAELAKRNVSGQQVDRLAASFEKLTEIERVMDGRPLPGSRRPGAAEPTRPSSNFHPGSFEPIPMPSPVACIEVCDDIQTPAPPVLPVLAGAVAQDTLPPLPGSNHRPEQTTTAPPVKPLPSPPAELPPPTVCYPEPGLWQTKVPATRTEAAEQRAKGLLSHQSKQRLRQRHGLA